MREFRENLRAIMRTQATKNDRLRHRAAEPQPNPTDCLTQRRQDAKTSGCSFAPLRETSRSTAAACSAEISPGGEEMELL